MLDTGTTCPAVAGAPSTISVPAAGSVVIRTASEAVGRRIGGIAEAEVGYVERVERVLGRGHRAIGAEGRVVDRGDVDRQRVGARVEVDSSIGRAAVVLHLEREARVGQAIGVGGRHEPHLAAGDAGHGHELPGK